MLYKRIVSLSCDIDIDVHDGGGQAQHDDAEGHHVVPQDNLCVVKDRPGPEQREWRLSSCEIIHKPNFDCSLVQLVTSVHTATGQSPLSRGHHVEIDHWAYLGVDPNDQCCHTFEFEFWWISMTLKFQIS